MVFDYGLWHKGVYCCRPTLERSHRSVGPTKRFLLSLGVGTETVRGNGLKSSLMLCSSGRQTTTATNLTFLNRIGHNLPLSSVQPITSFKRRIPCFPKERQGISCYQMQVFVTRLNVQWTSISPSLGLSRIIKGTTCSKKYLVR